jgi:type I restriction enzyme S subunit
MAPDHWKQTNLGELLEETEDRAGVRTLPVLSVTKSRGIMLASERFGKPLHGRDLTRYRVAPRHSLVVDPMLLWDGALGLQERVDAGLVSPDYRVFRPRSHVDAKFVSYLLKSSGMRRHFQSGARGTNVRRNRISRSDFLRIPVQLPPLPEQRKIAAILSSVDEAVENNENLIEQLQTTSRSLLRELLAGRLPDQNREFRDTEFGKIPSGWPVRPLGSLLREPIRNGYSAHTSAKAEGRWIAHLGAVTHNGFNRLAVKPVDAADQRVASSRLVPGDLLVSRSNTRERVGLAGVYRGVPEWCSYPDLLMRLRPGPEIDVDFLEQWLLGDHCRKYFSQSARGTSESMVKIDREIVQNCLVPVPPLEEQREIVRAAKTLGDRLQAECEWLRSLGATRAALLDALVSGRAPVNAPALEAA